jgi:flagella basal body P-ring formation protein FlgA
MNHLAQRWVSVPLAVLWLLPPSLAASAATAQRICVASDSLRVRDLVPAEAAAAATDQELDSTVVTGLLPGERRLLTPGEIRLRVAELGINAEAYGWRWTDAVEVARRSQVIPAEELVATGEKAIRLHLQLPPGDEAAVSPVMQPRSLLAPLGPLALSAVVRPPRLPGGLWVAEVTSGADGAAGVSCTIRYRVRVTGPVLVARQPIGRHQALTEDAVTSDVRDLSSLRGEPLRLVADLAGRRAARAASPGTVLTTDWVERMPAVHRGEFILATARVGAVCASTRARALADGKLGDLVRVRAGDSREEFLVRVTALGRGEVIASP